jgi:hypothetical protein
MKKEISPATMGVVIVIVVIVLGVFFYKKILVNPPSAHPQYGSAATSKTSTASPAPTSGQ